ncbi:hypothetical protein NC651_004246 [Populus alba x Populus x berolinensis]|nr:hypothetical protein NC651_004246 [Populus alba x Populus x berolinensis]
MNYPAGFLYQNLVAVASVSILYTLHLWACIITFQDAILPSTRGETSHNSSPKQKTTPTSCLTAWIIK